MDGEKNQSSLEREDVTVVNSGRARQSIVATALGNAMEWFDFGIYSYLAVTIGKVFFSEMNGSLQLVYSFAVFAISFLVRPVGGMVFGMLGDRIGRKKILTITIIMMALSTLSIGFIPGYQTIGITAPLLLLLARLVQGFSTGGEYSGAMTYIAESTPDKKRTRLSSGLEVGTLIGYIFGSGIVTLLTFLIGNHTMTAWGWRIPFFVAAPIGLIGLYLRTNLKESPAYETMDEEIDKDKRVSMKDILIHHRKPLWTGLILVFFYNVVDYTVLTYMPSHLNAVLGYGDTKSLLFILVVMVIMIPIIILMGYFGDRLGSKRIVQGGLIGLVLLSVPAFLLIGSGVGWMVFLGLMILAVCLASFQGTMPSLLPSLFFTDVRYGALSITYNVSTSLFGGTAPLVISYLIHQTGSHYIPAYYLIFASLIGVIVVTLLVRDPSGKPLRGSPPAVEEEREIDGVLEDTGKDLWWAEEKNQIDQSLADSLQKE